MCERCRFFLLLLSGVVLALAIVILVPSSEPSYHGRTLSQWLQLYSSTVYYSTVGLESPNRIPPGRKASPEEKNPRGNGDVTTDRARAAEAVRRIGIRALPCLLNWITYDPPRWKAKAQGAVNTVAGKLNVRWRWNDEAPGRAQLALTGFRILGPDAKSAIPDLTRLMNDPQGRTSASRATAALGHIGPAALPALLAVLTNQQARTRRLAVDGIAAMGTNARPAAPVLVAWALEREDTVAVPAAALLASLKLESEIVVPAMARCLARPERLIRSQAAEVLVVFREDARPAVPVLIQLLNQADEDLAELAAQTLGRLQLDADRVVPALIDRIDDPRPLVRFRARASLARFGKKARSAVPALLNALRDPDLYGRITATNALQRIAPEILTHAATR